MKLSDKQLDRLRQSATNPGRPTPETAPETVAPAGPPPEPAGNVVRALQDALWAIEHAESPVLDSGTMPVTEWQPISTAPMLRDLEVRIVDPVGRYSLLYPCRLVPDVGWINALVATPLSIEPVEWRDWLETMTDFR
jgi:hypothetical protein